MISLSDGVEREMAQISACGTGLGAEERETKSKPPTSIAALCEFPERRPMPARVNWRREGWGPEAARPDLNFGFTNGLPTPPDRNADAEARHRSPSQGSGCQDGGSRLIQDTRPLSDAPWGKAESFSDPHEEFR